MNPEKFSTPKNPEPINKPHVTNHLEEEFGFLRAIMNTKESSVQEWGGDSKSEASSAVIEATSAIQNHLDSYIEMSNETRAALWEALKNVSTEAENPEHLEKSLEAGKHVGIPIPRESEPYRTLEDIDQALGRTLDLSIVADREEISANNALIEELTANGDISSLREVEKLKGENSAITERIHGYETKRRPLIVTNILQQIDTIEKALSTVEDNEDREEISANNALIEELIVKTDPKSLQEIEILRQLNSVIEERIEKRAQSNDIKKSKLILKNILENIATFNDSSQITKRHEEERATV